MFEPITISTLLKVYGLAHSDHPWRILPYIDLEKAIQYHRSGQLEIFIEFKTED